MARMPPDCEQRYSGGDGQQSQDECKARRAGAGLVMLGFRLHLVVK
jgi:hypothetical protein